MKSLLTSILALSLVFALGLRVASAQIATEANEINEVIEVNSFEMFWPIVAGKVRGEPLYFLKRLKEKARGLLTLSQYKKSEYNLRLSEKRLVEAEKLYLESKDYENAEDSLEEGNELREESLENLTKADEAGRDTGSLREDLKKSLANQVVLLNYIAERLLESERQSPQESAAQADELLQTLL